MKERFMLTQEGGDVALTFKTLRGAVNYVRVEYKCERKETYGISLMNDDGTTLLLFTFSPLDRDTIERMLNDYLVW